MDDVRACVISALIDSNCGCSNTDGFACFKQINLNVCEPSFRKKYNVNSPDEVAAFLEETEIEFTTVCHIGKP
jgi:hypothetical protein